MPAREKFHIVVRPVHTQAVLRAIAPVVTRHLGPLRTLMVLDYKKYTHSDRVLNPSEDPADQIPDFLATELVRFYPAEPRGGELGIAHEGEFDVVDLSLIRPPDTEAVAWSLWALVRDMALALVAGEELEVGEAELRELFARGAISDSMDLCRLAIYWPPDDPSAGREAVVLRR